MRRARRLRRRRGGNGMNGAAGVERCNRTGSGSMQNCEINKESRQNEGRKSRRRNRIAVGAGKRQALKHGEVDVLPGSGVRSDDVFAGTPVTTCRFNNTKSFRLTFEPLGKCLLIKDVAIIITF